MGFAEVAEKDELRGRGVAFFPNRDEVVVIAAVHREDPVEVAEVRRLHLTRPPAHRDPSCLRGAAHAEIGWVSDVVSGSAGRVDDKLRLVSFFPDEVIHHIFTGGRAADVAETDEEKTGR